ncbi:MAG: hypothetical protein REI64_03745 [Pedobacter sp.]|uniref:hypothetical protein n=1 Tax=Pedobacter sp. TaxID=1411316 RepID=UPI002807E017|nr:hypothetical protein [Pedobacter sp.]MDQ8003888.1 hypothetical protein [Pedobacter sp.]
MKKILCAIALVGLFSACDNSKNNTQTQVPTATQGGLSGLQNAPAATTESQTSLLTNPEHGKPGHDCALPVGAPLKQKATTQQSTAPVPNTPVAPEPVAAKPSSAQKLNPAHGQPGHDCAKPVGAPLS